MPDWPVHTGRPADTGLPVEAAVGQLFEALSESDAVVLSAEPGAGKTTVLPLRLLDHPVVAQGSIVLLEPRRLAARGAAARMADLLGENIGDTVGLITRDEHRISGSTRITVITEGVLTRRLQSDPSLAGTSLVIFDEFHERTLPADMAMAMCRSSRALGRGTFKMLVMSATLDTETVADALDAPTISVPGRTFPVELSWQPARRQERLDAQIVRAFDQMRDHPGDMLVFLPGIGEMSAAKAALTQHLAPDPFGDLFDIHMLAGSMSFADQDAALAPSGFGRRKIVLSTNVAESSLTVEGIGVVIDSGLAKEPRFNPATGTTRLKTLPISRSSADQRSGRAGRVQEGSAIRLWSKVEHAARPRFATPEIASTDPSEIVLECAAWTLRTGDDLTTWLTDLPNARARTASAAMLESIGCLTGGAITQRGEAVLALPCSPRLGVMLLDADAEGHGWLACLIAALIENSDILRHSRNGEGGRGPHGRNEPSVDLAYRVELLEHGDHAARPGSTPDGRAVERVRADARDLAARLGCAPTGADLSQVGATVARAYPDRIATAQGSKGRFRLEGTSAWVPTGDPLAAVPIIVVAEADDRSKERRIRLAASLM